MAGDQKHIGEHSIAQRVRESTFFFIDDLTEHEDGLLVTLRVRQPEEVLHLVLGGGAGATVLEPEWLRQQVREEIAKMAKRY